MKVNPKNRITAGPTLHLRLNMEQPYAIADPESDPFTEPVSFWTLVRTYSFFGSNPRQGGVASPYRQNGTLP
jgi:hypothetical protein